MSYRVPECLILLPDGTYKCSKLGFIIKKLKLPFVCAACGIPAINIKDENIQHIGLKPKLPPITRQITNFTKAVATHAMDMFKNVTEEQHNQRIQVCNSCDKRCENRCVECGCFINKKSWWHSSTCPINKWPKIE